jgi:chromosome partitioning protein
MEEHRSPEGQPAQFRFYCSQQCLSRSHSVNDTVGCDGCSVGFRVTQAGQVLYLKGQRRYACSEACRKQVLSEQAGARLGDAVKTSEAPTSDCPRVIAVFNHKGGTGKTTTAVTLAAGLAHRGHRTLLVDTDAQGNVAVSLGLGAAPRSLYHVLVMGLPVKDAVVSARPNLDVLCSNETLAAAELYLAGRQNRDRILATRLAATKASYDYVVVDCSPSLSLLNQNALVFADSVLCPVACDYLSLVGVRQVVKTIKNVNRLLAHPVQLWGVLPTLYDRRARICNEALETMREHFQERCLQPIRSAIRVKEAPSQGKTVFEYDAESDVAGDYLRVVDRVISQTSNVKSIAPAHLSATGPLLASA